MGKPFFIICFLIIAAISYLAVAGVHYQVGDTDTAIIKGAKDIRFGIDIRGGVEATFRPPNGTKVSQSDMSAAVERLRTRLDSLHISDSEIYPSNTSHRIIVRFPWKSDEATQDPETAIKELGAMAQLTFKDPSSNVILTGNDVKSAQALPDPQSQGYMVQLQFKASGTKKFADATTKFVGKQISIYMDEKQIETATVQSAITDGTAEINDTASPMTAQQATQLADQINAGALPFKLVTDNYSTISPTMGQNALNVMVKAGVVAFIIICLFMIVYYRMPGLIACIALCGHLAGTILCISIPQFTLTIPGIAGIILSIGMGVDANVITAERIKEELNVGKTLDAAIDSGFDRSLSAILDGNVTVLIVGAMLMIFGSGSVHSFGYTLIIGVVFNILMGIIFSRLMLKSISRLSGLRKNRLFGGVLRNE